MLHSFKIWFFLVCLIMILLCSCVGWWQIFQKQLASALVRTNAHSDLSFPFISDEFCSCGVNLFSGQLTTTELMQIRMQLIQEISNHKPNARQTCQLKVLCQLSAYMIQWEPTKYSMHNNNTKATNLYSNIMKQSGRIQFRSSPS